MGFGFDSDNGFWRVSITRKGCVTTDILEQSQFRPHHWISSFSYQWNLFGPATNFQIDPTDGNISLPTNRSEKKDFQWGHFMKKCFFVGELQQSDSDQFCPPPPPPPSWSGHCVNLSAARSSWCSNQQSLCFLVSSVNFHHWTAPISFLAGQMVIIVYTLFPPLTGCLCFYWMRCVLVSCKGNRPWQC